MLLSAVLPLHGQTSLASAVELAMQHSPRVRIAGDDVDRADAAQRENKDAYKPKIGAAGGLGYSYGITLGVPTIFTLDAQSLVFSSSQRHYLQAAKLEKQAATLSLTDAREAVMEDVAITYAALNRAQATRAALAEESAAARRLGRIVEERRKAGLESDEGAHGARRTVVQVRLQSLQLEDEISGLQLHLAELVGVPVDQLVLVATSIPNMIPFDDLGGPKESSLPDSPAVLAAAANARAKQERATADSRFRWRPVVTVEGQYGRVSPVNGVTDYYNIHGNYNTAFAALQFQLPFLDAARRDRAQAAASDAAHAAHELALLQSRQTEDRARTRHSFAQLQAKAELAELDMQIAQDQVKATVVQMSSKGLDGAPVTPKEEQTAIIRERQLYIEYLEAQFALQKAHIFLLRQIGKLHEWIFVTTS